MADDTDLDESQGRRAVLNDARRKVERALAIVDAAEELAKAVQAVLKAAESRQIDLQSVEIAALRDALAKHQAMSGG